MEPVQSLPVVPCLLCVNPCGPCAELFPSYSHACRKPGAYTRVFQGWEKGEHLGHLCLSSAASLHGLALGCSPKDEGSQETSRQEEAGSHLESLRSAAYCQHSALCSLPVASHVARSILQLELALELRVSRRREAHAELITGLESELRTRPLARAVVGHEELCRQLVEGRGDKVVTHRCMWVPQRWVGNS